MLAGLAHLVDEASRAFEGYDYARAIERTEGWFWQFCDDYLELVKGRAYGSDDAAGAAVGGRRRCSWPWSPSSSLFAPFLPFATEEVWSWWRADAGSIHRSPWPSSAPLQAAAGDVGTDVLAVTAETLGEIRKAKTEAKRRSMRTDVVRAAVVATRGAGRLACDLAAGDLAEAGRVATLTIDDGAADAARVDVELAPPDEPGPALTDSGCGRRRRPTARPSGQPASCPVGATADPDALAWPLARAGPAQGPTGASPTRHPAPAACPGRGRRPVVGTWRVPAERRRSSPGCGCGAHPARRRRGSGSPMDALAAPPASRGTSRRSCTSTPRPTSPRPPPSTTPPRHRAVRTETRPGTTLVSTAGAPAPSAEAAAHEEGQEIPRGASTRPPWGPSRACRVCPPSPSVATRVQVPSTLGEDRATRMGRAATTNSGAPVGQAERQVGAVDLDLGEPQQGGTGAGAGAEVGVVVGLPGHEVPVGRPPPTARAAPPTPRPATRPPRAAPRRPGVEGARSLLGPAARVVGGRLAGPGAVGDADQGLGAVAEGGGPPSAGPSREDRRPGEDLVIGEDRAATMASVRRRQAATRSAGDGVRGTGTGRRPGPRPGRRWARPSTSLVMA